MLKIYENIRKLRIERGLSQDELAILVGYKNRSSIARIERGDVNLPQNVILKFAEVFDVYPGDLMGWDEADNTDQYSPDEKAVIHRYRMLNKNGRKTALNRLEELTLIAKYTKAEKP